MADGILPIPTIPQPLRDAAQRGTLIPFVGAGASVLAGCPTWGQLADGALRACIDANKFTYAQLAQIEHLSARVKLSIARGLETENKLKIDYAKLINPKMGYENNELGSRVYATPTRPIYQLLANNGVFEAALTIKLQDRSREKIAQWVCLAYLWGDESLTSPLMAQIFAGGVEDLQEATEFFWRVHGEKLTPDHVERVLAFWERALEWARGQEKMPVGLFARLARLAPFLSTLDKRAKALLLAVVTYVHTDYATDHMVEELDRLADGNSAAAAEIMERMFEASTPNFDMDDNIKKLLRKLYDKGHQAEVLRCVERLQKTLPGMLEFYKTLGAPIPNS